MRAGTLLVNLMAGANLNTNTEVNIRLFDPQCQQDRDAVMLLVRELQSHELALFDRMKPPDQIEGESYIQHLCDECEAKEGCILLAEKVHSEPRREEPSRENINREATQSAIVGYAVVLTRVTNNDRIEEVPYVYGELLELAVTATCRGLGIGQLLLGASEQKVRDMGVDYFRTSVLASNPQAHQLYERFGFADHLVEMEKKLSE